MDHLTLPDGRILEYLVEGLADAVPLVFHNGTPAAAVRYAPLFDAALSAGLRIVLPSRPGYGDSSPQPGRRVASVAADTSVLLDALGATSFVTAGWSGGGPHALACAALLPDRCRAAATIAAVAPHDAVGLDWLDGMGEENLAEFGAAAAGGAELRTFLAEAAAGMSQIQPHEVAAGLGDLIAEVDRQAVVGPFADFLAASFRRAVAHGIDGWLEDDLAFVTDWGFAPSDIKIPVTLWQGDQDRMVPFAHGAWLAGQLPTAQPHLLPGEGHLSLIDSFATIVTELTARL
jgi:pimeloyl-ACP methyl ester carboxylesterase